MSNEKHNDSPGTTWTDKDFFPIRAEGLSSGNKCAFDVFVRLESGRYLKLLNAGDQLSPERLESYLKKGVTHFYLRKDVQEAYLEFFKKLSAAAVNSPNLSIQAKTAQTLSHGEEVMSIIQAQGVSAENIQYAKEFISDVRLLTAQLKPEKNGIVAKYIDDVAAYEHGVSTSMLAGILSHVVEIRMDKPVQIVGLAGLFHDVGLAGLPKEVRNENDTTLSPENKALYRTHPALGAKALRDAGTMDPGVLQAIEQHHMRHLGQGFPEKTGTSPLGKVGEIIGLCEEFNRMLLRGKADPTLHVLRTMEATVFPGFSRQIVYAFRSAFFPKIN